LEEDDDDDDDDDMPPRRVPPPALAPPARAPAARAPPARAPAARAPAAGLVDQVARDLAGLNVTGVQPFNFSARFPVMTIQTTSINDGRCKVVLYYLIPTVSSSRMVLETSPDGKHALFSLRLPQSFVDVASRLGLEIARTHLDQAVYASAYRSHQDALLQAHADMNNIMTQPQRDPLPFACNQTPDLTLLLLEGDNELQEELRSSGDTNQQYTAVARAIFTGSDVQRSTRVVTPVQIIRSPVAGAAAGHGSGFQPPPPAPPSFGQPREQQAFQQQQKGTYATLPVSPPGGGQSGDPSPSKRVRKRTEFMDENPDLIPDTNGTNLDNRKTPY